MSAWRCARLGDFVWSGTHFSFEGDSMWIHLNLTWLSNLDFCHESGPSDVALLSMVFHAWVSVLGSTVFLLFDQAWTCDNPERFRMLGVRPHDKMCHGHPNRLPGVGARSVDLFGTQHL